MLGFFVCWIFLFRIQSTRTTASSSYHQPHSAFVGTSTRTSAFFGRPTWWSSYHASTPRKSVNNNNRHQEGNRQSCCCCRLSMVIRVGILGLPNVGKSSLFNALAQQSIAAAENYPFCTIDPNIAPIPVPSTHLQALCDFNKKNNAVPATMRFIDVAGLAKNAHRGEGLGNRFLATLRECHALVHVVRAFPTNGDDGCMGTVDPISDATDCMLELVLADLEHAQRRLDRIDATVVGKKNDYAADDNHHTIEQRTLEKIQRELQSDRLASSAELSAEELSSIRSMGLLTLKPMLYAFNVDEADLLFNYETTYQDAVTNVVPHLPYYCLDQKPPVFCIVSAKLEADIVTGQQSSISEFLLDLGVDDDNDQQQFEQRLCYNVLPLLICELLDLSMVYTGPGVAAERSQTVKAHLISSSPTGDRTTTAHDLAGNIHKDIQNGFIRAEVVSAPDLLKDESWVNAKEAGHVRTEGKDYALQNQDVVLIKWKG